MVTRRAVVTGTVLSGLGVAGTAGAIGPAAGQAGQTDASDAIERASREIAAVLRGLREDLAQQRTTGAVSAPVQSIRDNQKIFFRAQGKFPEFIDVGIDIWQAVVDWFIRTRQQIGYVRLPSDRLGLSFLLTTLVLRNDVPADHISLGYDPK